jgi:uncharacterized ubiquitin-like protein YukD
MAAALSSALRKDSLDFRSDGAVRCKLAVSEDSKALFSGVAGAKVTLAGIAHPTSDFEAATKYYVDTVASGLTVKGSVQYAVTGNLEVQYSEDRMALVGTGAFSALSAALFDLNPLNGATIALQTASPGFANYAPIAANADELVATRFLVKGQTDKKRNGAYFLEASTADGWTLRRCANFNDDPSGEIKAGSFVFVTSGYRHVNHGFVLVSDAGEKTLRVNGATPNDLQFEQFSGAGQVSAGTNLNKTGDTINLNANVDVTDLHTDTLTARNHAEFNSTVHADGAVTFGSTLGLTGKITAQAQDHKLADFTVNNGSIVSSSGALTIGSNAFDAGGAATLGSTLAVTGATSTARAYLACTAATAPSTAINEISDAKLVVSGAALVSSHAQIQGKLWVGNNVHATGKIESANDLKAQLSIFQESPDAYAWFRGHTKMFNDTEMVGPVTMGDTLGVTGKITAQAQDHKIADFTVDNGSIVSASGALTIGSNTFNAGGAATLGSTLDVTGKITALAEDHKLADFTVNNGSIVSASGALTIGSNTFNAGGAATLGSTLDVTGKVTALAQDHKIADFTVDNGSIVSASGALTIGSNTFNAGGAATLGSTLAVTGKITALAEDHKIADFTVDNGSIVSSSGALTIGSNTFDAGGAATLGSTLDVTGKITALAQDHKIADFTVDNGSIVSASGSLTIGSNTFAAGGAATLGSTLAVTGAITALAEDHKIADFTIDNGSMVSSSGAFSIGNNSFAANGAVTFGSTVGVTGVITAAAQGHNLADFTVNNGSIVSSSGALSIGSNSLTVGGAATMQSTLAVTGAITSSAQNHQLADFTITNGSVVSASPTISHGSNNVTTSGDISSTNMSFTTLLSGATATFTADCTAQNFYATSDVNLKHEIRQIEGAVAQCQKLRGVEFKWKHGEDKRDQMGVIAQEVEAVYPSLVAEVDGYRRVDYSKLVGLLIEAVKELKAESAQLKAESAQLKAEVAELRAK